MGALERSLAIHLAAAGEAMDVATGLAAPRDAHFTQEQRRSMQQVFADLGGVGELPSLRTGAWDLWFDGVLVELDEAQHFNRYRVLTLAAPWMSFLPWAGAYGRFCDDHEDACLKKARHGGYWSSNSTERWFGAAGAPGDLESAGGSPRWKQRAMYDAVKDAYAAWSTTWSVARVSVYDDVAGVPLGKGLVGKGELDLNALLELIQGRTTSPGLATPGAARS